MQKINRLFIEHHQEEEMIQRTGMMCNFSHQIKMMLAARKILKILILIFSNIYQIKKKEKYLEVYSQLS